MCFRSTVNRQGLRWLCVLALLTVPGAVRDPGKPTSFIPGHKRAFGQTWTEEPAWRVAALRAPPDQTTASTFSTTSEEPTQSLSQGRAEGREVPMEERQTDAPDAPQMEQGALEPHEGK